jgi:superfamily II DNA/RNA helicase
VFCRFIPTAEYLAAHLREHLAGRAEVVAVTGTLPPAEREQRVLELAKHPVRVLVATDCLSEGINLQEHFDAVVHADLSWNPTRHQQREGRTDRYGQPRDVVKVVTMYGTDNAIDGIVLDVLLRKHQQIRKSLGVAVPVPVGTAEVMEAIFEGLLLRERSGNAADVEQLVMFDEFAAPKRTELHASWDAAAEREKRASLYAQASIKVDEVAAELAAARAAVGSAADVAGFVRAALTAHGGHLAPGSRDSVVISLAIPRPRCATRSASPTASPRSAPGSTCRPATGRPTCPAPTRSSRGWRATCSPARLTGSPTPRPPGPG